MKKFLNKNRDLINILLLIVIFVFGVIIILRDKYIWASYIDYLSQHSVIPEYFRTLFYSTHDVFPDFAFNLGAGQNIYNYAYYGLFNPVIMISYLLPFVNMRDYLMYSSIILVIVSGVLFYLFLRKNKFSYNVSLVTSICFMLSSSLVFHSHRHIMFINYMPFLISALFGVNRYFDKNRSDLLSISTLLIILMSYYYSIPSIICIVVYGVYYYIKEGRYKDFKLFLRDGCKFIFPIMIGILACGILIVPEFYSVLSNRMDSPINISLFDLLVPKFNLSYLMYNSYGVGLTSIVLFGLIYLFYSKEKENRFLFIVLSLIFIFPIFNYILNATMYIDAKALIPFLTLYSIGIASFFRNIDTLKVRGVFIIISVIVIFSLIMNSYYSYYIVIEIIVSFIVFSLCRKYKHNNIFMCYVVLISLISFVVINENSDLVLKNLKYFDDYNSEKELVNSINDKDFYRISVSSNRSYNVNNIYGNINMYQSNIYSSLYNIDYNKFYFDVFNNVMQSRNRLITSANNNLLFHMFMNEEYIINYEDKNVIGYNPIKCINKICLYENNEVLPLMYISYNNINYSDASLYSFPYNNELLLKHSVTDSKSNSNYNSNIIKFNDINVIDSSIDYKYENNSYSFSTNKNDYIKFSVPDYVKDKIIFIKFKINNRQSCNVGDRIISINGEKNSLTCDEWKYYNGNTEFTYVISLKDNDDVLVRFSKGEFDISDIGLYYLDYSDINDINSNITKVNIDKDKTKGDKIYASVKGEKDGYFISSIPYQDGFSIYVDGEKIDYEKVNYGFIGFKINSGEHDIIFEYNSPFKNIGVIVSISGIILFICNIVIQRCKKK